MIDLDGWYVEEERGYTPDAIRVREDILGSLSSYFPQVGDTRISAKQISQKVEEVLRIESAPSWRGSYAHFLKTTNEFYVSGPCLICPCDMSIYTVNYTYLNDRYAVVESVSQDSVLNRKSGIAVMLEQESEEEIHLCEKCRELDTSTVIRQMSKLSRLGLREDIKIRCEARTKQGSRCGRVGKLWQGQPPHLCTLHHRYNIVTQTEDTLIGGNEVIRIYNHSEDEDRVRISLVTDYNTEEEFARRLAPAMLSAVEDLSPTLKESAIAQTILKSVDIVCKLRGYKNEVKERRIMLAGEVWPDDDDVPLGVTIPEEQEDEQTREE